MLAHSLFRRALRLIAAPALILLVASADLSAQVVRPTSANTGPTSGTTSTNNAAELNLYPGDNDTYSRVAFTRGLLFKDGSGMTANSTAAATFIDCTFTSLNIITFGKMTVNLIRCRAVDGVVLQHNTGGGIINVEYCEFINSNGTDCGRIQRQYSNAGTNGTTTVNMSHSIWRTSGPNATGSHRDALQIYGGRNITMTNVVFNLNDGQFTSTQAGQNVALFLENANGGLQDITFTDCWIVASGSNFLLGVQNCTNVNFIRPRIERATTTTYPSDYVNFTTAGRASVTDPLYEDDLSAAPLSRFTGQSTPPPATPTTPSSLTAVPQ